MSINNKNDRNDWGKCLGWPVTSYWYVCKVVVTSNQGKTHSLSDLVRNKSCLVFHKLWSLWNGLICQRKEKNGCNAFCTGAKIRFSGKNILSLGALSQNSFCSYFEIASATNWLRTCACSFGGPGRKRDEHRGGRSTLGTEINKVLHCPVTVAIQRQVINNI